MNPLYEVGHCGILHLSSVWLLRKWRRKEIKRVNCGFLVVWDMRSKVPNQLGLIQPLGLFEVIVQFVMLNEVNEI